MDVAFGCVLVQVGPTLALKVYHYHPSFMKIICLSQPFVIIISFASSLSLLVSKSPF